MMTKVILIGGSPMTGKSTVAMALASELKWACLSADDIGEVLQTVTNINPMRGQNYSDYYMNTDKEQLIEDIKKYHAQIKPAIKRLIDIHRTWSTPIIIEGWALYPDIMDDLETEAVKSVWLIADKQLLETRLKSNASFYKNAGDPEKMIENYLFRSQWHNEFLLQQCKLRNQKYVLINGSESPRALAAKICNELIIEVNI